MEPEAIEGAVKELYDQVDSIEKDQAYDQGVQGPDIATAEREDQMPDCPDKTLPLEKRDQILVQ